VRKAQARLIKRVTDDGLLAVKDHVPLGQPYTVDLDSRRQVDLFNVEFKRFHQKDVVTVLAPVRPFAHHAVWMPTDLLAIEGE